MGKGMEMEVKFTFNDEVVDIDTMRQFSVDEYRSYLEPYLFFVDHHGILRSTLGQWSYATKAEQVRELIRYLQEDVLPKCEE
ncbi:hypothetical protein D3C81_451550 [compost metagenome]